MSGKVPVKNLSPSGNVPTNEIRNYISFTPGNKFSLDVCKTLSLYRITFLENCIWIKVFKIGRSKILKRLSSTNLKNIWVVYICQIMPDLFWNETRARDWAGMEHYKSNAIWFYLSNIKDEGSEVYRFGKLTRVRTLI